jgi:hypothetical protein
MIMPFGEYKDFKDCVSKNQDKNDAEAYCAEIKRAIEGNADVRTKETLSGFIINTSDKKGEPGKYTMEVVGILLAEGMWNNLWYSNMELKKVAHLFSGTQLTIDHSQSVRNIIGEITEAKFTESGVDYRATIYDQQIIGLIEAGAKFGISAELFATKFNNKKLKRLEAVDIEPVRASLVLDAACPPPTCTVNPVENMREIATELLASKCEAPYMNKERTKYKKGFLGCVEAKRNCAGLDKDHAEKMCNYIFWRRTGHGYSRITVDDIVELTTRYAALETDAEREKMIEGLVNEMVLCEKFHKNMKERFNDTFSVEDLEIMCDYFRYMGELSPEKLEKMVEQDFTDAVIAGKLWQRLSSDDNDATKNQGDGGDGGDGETSCPEGESFDKDKGECVKNEQGGSDAGQSDKTSPEDKCGEGQTWDSDKEECVDAPAENPTPPPKNENSEDAEYTAMKEFMIEGILSKSEDFKVEELREWDADKLITVYKLVNGQKKKSEKTPRKTQTGLKNEREPVKTGLKYNFVD